MKFKYQILLLLILSFTSCQKYLDEKQNNSVRVPKSLSDLQALLDDSFLMNEIKTPSGGETYTDIFFILKEDYNTMNSWNQNLYKFSPDDNPGFPNDWSYAYIPIYNANYALERTKEIQRVEDNKELWDRVKGAALFFRSYYYLQLVWTFSKAYDDNSSSTDLGVPLRLSSDFNVPSNRATVKECYDRIINDTKEAAPLLPSLPTHAFRPSKAGAYGLLSRAYLSMRQYDSAFKYADMCLQIKSTLLNFNTDAEIDPFNYYPIARFNKESIFYTEINGKSASLVNYAKIDTVLYSAYDPNDQRKTLFFYNSVGNYYDFVGSYGGDIFLFSGIATDEMYLNRAECFARKGNTTSAMTDLNTLLSKRYNQTFIPLTAASSTDALNKILEERKKELIFRGLRFIDIKRLNKEGANISVKRVIEGQPHILPPNDNRYALPIPRDIIDQTGMPQN